MIWSVRLHFPDMGQVFTRHLRNRTRQWPWLVESPRLHAIDGPPGINMPYQGAVAGAETQSRMYAEQRQTAARYPYGQDDLIRICQNRSGNAVNQAGNCGRFKQIANG